MCLCTLVMRMQHSCKAYTAVTKTAPAPSTLMCDPRWADDVMGVPGADTSTLCQEGCVVASLAAGLQRHGEAVTPRELNHRLRTAHAYECTQAPCAAALFSNWHCDCNQINPAAVARALGLQLLRSWAPLPSLTDLAARLRAGRIILARVSLQDPTAAWYALCSACSRAHLRLWCTCSAALPGCNVARCMLCAAFCMRYVLCVVRTGRFSSSPSTYRARS